MRSFAGRLASGNNIKLGGGVSTNLIRVSHPTVKLSTEKLRLSTFNRSGKTEDKPSAEERFLDGEDIQAQLVVFVDSRVNLAGAVDYCGMVPPAQQAANLGGRHLQLIHQ